MKKYFAKYLPVEGEIKFPANIYCLSEGLRLNCQSMVCPDCRLAKLFLCSRDIKVGDKVRSDKEPHIEYELNDGNNRALLFKVIGEISPEATWVKEGDDFDEDEWMPMLAWGSEDFYSYQEGEVKEIFYSNPLQGWEIKILCNNCKHFH